MALHDTEGYDPTGDSPLLDDEQGSGLAGGKKRRVRACDMCRRRKVGCDGVRMPGRQCSNCRAFQYSCTYTQSSKKRFADPEYVQNLESQLAQTKVQLQKLSSRLEILDSQHAADTQSPTSDQESSQISVRLPNIAASFDRDLDDADFSDEMTLRHSIEQRMKHLSIGPTLPQFLGKSSGLSFIQTALDFNEAYDTGQSYSAQEQLADTRPEFWGELRWLKEPSAPYPAYVFPEPDLMHALRDLYFENYNVYLPLLHRPTFQRSLQQGLHLVNDSFGATVLLTCALGAKFSDDPRTLLVESNNHSSGWKWFKCVQETRRAFRSAAPCIYDLQIYAMVAEFLHISPIAGCSPAVVGAGVRTAQDLGAHRHKVYATLPADEGELLKRAFWVLVSIDRIISSGLGRSCCIQDEDFDVDYPRECDDEYWYNEKGEPVFEQPPGKPSLIAFFNCLIRLNQIHGCALRSIYATNKSKSLLGFTGPDWEQYIVTELDSALNKWADTIPSHLKWDPHIQNMTHLNQAAHLYTSYYYLQIVIHRPYLPSPRKRNPSPFPSLAICTNAARSCIHVTSIQYARSAGSTWQNIITLFVSAVVLLLNIWTSKRAGGHLHSDGELANLHKVMFMLKALEQRWHVAGRLRDVLCELVAAGDLPLPPRWDDSSTSTSSSSRPLSQPMADDAQNPPPKRYRLQETPISSMSPFVQGTTPCTLPAGFEHSDGSLPMHSDELGRYPIYPASSNSLQSSVDFTSSVNSWAPMVTDPPVPSNSKAISSTDSDLNMNNMLNSRLGPNTVSYQTPENFFGYTPPPELPSSTGDQSRPPPGSEPQATWGTLPAMRDSVTESLWSNAPHSIEWEDWGRYIMTMNGMESTANPNSTQSPF